MTSRLTHLVMAACLVALAACTGPNAAPAAQGSGYRYDDLPAAGTQDAAIANYSAISQWDKTDLTYAFLNGSADLPGEEEQQVVTEAFGLWAAQTPLTFTEVSEPSQADIVIGWASGDHGDGDPFDGPGDVLAHSSFPNPYSDRQVIMHFDEDERWVDSTTQDVDLLTVAAHEIGHTLGLDHSRDPSSLMYPSYSGPHRFLGDDDLVGIHSLYGIASRPEPVPEVPPSGVTPPPSQSQDSDGDGISDQDELLRTGTDPQKEDTDGDGLGDGVEVLYRMNPLDPDMDKDGVSDGGEVANGTDPFSPDQPADVPAGLEQDVSDFLTEAIKLEIRAFRENDPTVASGVMAGDTYAQLESAIDSLRQRDQLEIAEIDYYQSYIDDIRVISSLEIEVDTCEVWTFEIYRQSDAALIDSQGPELIPQTITIRKLEAGWFITSVDFFDPPSFCR